MSYEQIAEKFYQEHQEIVRDMFVKYLAEQEKNKLLTQLLISKSKALRFKSEVNRMLRYYSESKVAEMLNVPESIIYLYKNKKPKNNSKRIGTINKYGKGIYIKTKEGWKSYTKYLYEQYHNVKLEKSDRVKFIDGNYKNINIKNLKLYDRK